MLQPPSGGFGRMTPTAMGLPARTRSWSARSRCSRAGQAPGRLIGPTAGRWTCCMSCSSNRTSAPRTPQTPGMMPDTTSNVGSAINILDLLPLKPLSARVARRRPAPARHNIAPDPADRLVDITDISRMVNFFGLSCTQRKLPADAAGSSLVGNIVGGPGDPGLPSRDPPLVSSPCSGTGRVAHRPTGHRRFRIREDPHVGGAFRRAAVRPI